MARKRCFLTTFVSTLAGPGVALTTITVRVRTLKVLRNIPLPGNRNSRILLRIPLLDADVLIIDKNGILSLHGGSTVSNINRTAITRRPKIVLVGKSVGTFPPLFIT